MRLAFVRGGEPQRSWTATPDASEIADLVAELVQGGLVSAGVDEDGDVSFALTRQGRKVAQQMAMRRDAHALVLLGALVASHDNAN